MKETYEDFQSNIFKLETLAYNHSQTDYSPRYLSEELHATDEWVEEKMKEVFAEAYEQEYQIRAMLHEGLSDDMRDSELHDIRGNFQRHDRVMDELEEKFEHAYNTNETNVAASSTDV